jgi:hypothetical protein
MTGRRAHILILAVTALIAGALLYQYRSFFHDDAYISLRYVQNFLNGNGLCWNPGERVEGYSNFLLVIMVSALGRLGMELVLATKVIGIASYLALIWFAYREPWKRDRGASDSLLRFIPVIVVATSAPIVIWSLGGLETILFSLLVTTGVLLFIRTISDEDNSMILCGFVFGLATLCRPEGVLFAAMAVGYGFFSHWYKNRKIDLRLVGFVTSAAVMVVPHLIFRFVYYGEFLPNTWYVKGPQSLDLMRPGWEYLSGYAGSFPFILPIIAGLLTAAIVRRAFDWEIGFLITVITGYLGFVFFIGGDHMPAFRMIAPIIPVCGFLLWRLLSSIGQINRARPSGFVVCAVIVLCAGQLIWPGELVRRAKVTDGAAFLGSLIGKYINANWPEGSLVALNTAGSTPYFAPKLRFIDMLGLNDTTIARRKNIPLRTKMQEWPGHGKGDGVYVLSRKPDYIIIGPTNGDFANNFPWFLSDYELGGSAEFERLYQPVKVIISAAQAGHENYTESALGALRFVYYQRRQT